METGLDRHAEIVDGKRKPLRYRAVINAYAMPIGIKTTSGGDPRLWKTNPVNLLAWRELAPQRFEI